LEAFRWGALNGRADLVPYLLRELKEKGPWEEQAAEYLAYVGGHDLAATEKALLETLKSSNSNLRAAGAWALGRLRSERAFKPLRRLLVEEKSPVNRAIYCEALALCGGAKAAPILCEVMERGSGADAELGPVRDAAAAALAGLGDPRGRARLLALLDSPVVEAQLAGLTGLLRLGGPSVPGLLRTALLSQHEVVWLEAVRLFPLSGAPGVNQLREMLASPQAEHRFRAALALSACGSDEGRPMLVRALRWGVPRMQARAAEALGRRGAWPATDGADAVGTAAENAALLEALRAGDRAVRQAAAVALTHRRAQAALPLLLEAARVPTSGAAVLPRWLIPSREEEARERALYLSCVRVLSGERDNLEIASAPDRHDAAWPEFDALVAQRRAELLKGWILRAVIRSEGRPVGAVLCSAEGEDERLYLLGETVAVGFVLNEIRADVAEGQVSGVPLKNAHPLSFAVLSDGKIWITLYQNNGLPAEIRDQNAEKK
jgi:HEAT repeat protein